MQLSCLTASQLHAEAPLQGWLMPLAAACSHGRWKHPCLPGERAGPAPTASVGGGAGMAVAGPPASCLSCTLEGRKPSSPGCGERGILPGFCQSPRRQLQVIMSTSSTKPPPTGSWAPSSHPRARSKGARDCIIPQTWAWGWGPRERAHLVLGTVGTAITQDEDIT